MSAAESQRTHCPHCSAAVEPLQEYCLECGSRLPQEQPTALERASLRIDERHPWSTGWLVPTLVGLVVAGVGTGAAIAISDESQPEAAPSTAIGGGLTVTDLQETLAAPAPTARQATTKPTTTTAPPARPSVPRAISWPPDKRGWTIVLLSVPQGNGRAAATQRADEARRGGLRRVGVLNSSRYASLHPGYYVVFHGIFDSEAEATSALQRARGVFRPAYPREIVP